MEHEIPASRWHDVFHSLAESQHAIAYSLERTSAPSRISPAVKGAHFLRPSIRLRHVRRSATSLPNGARRIVAAVACKDEYIRVCSWQVRAPEGAVAEHDRCRAFLELLRRVKSCGAVLALITKRVGPTHLRAQARHL